MTIDDFHNHKVEHMLADDYKRKLRLMHRTVITIGPSPMKCVHTKSDFRLYHNDNLVCITDHLKYALNKFNTHV